MAQMYTMKNGLRLIVHEMQGLMSVSMGILVGAGGAYESDEEDGISHYIEHMQFKGTPTRTAEQISAGFDDIGAQVNAFTGKDLTCYYAKATLKTADKAFEMLADLFLNATFPDEEAEREKGVICEEIAMNEDSPEDVCLDLLATAQYGKEGYGRNILGSAKNVRGFTRTDVEKYKAKLYRPENIVLSFAGALPFARAQALAEKYFSRLQSGAFLQPEKKLFYEKKNLYKNKPIEQVHLALAYGGFSRSDKLFKAGQLMNIALGSGMSSRLFLQVREKLGLAYTVYSYATAYNECGHFTVYAGVNPKNRQKAFDAIREVFASVRREGLTKEEFARAREQVRASDVFSQENTSSQMLYFGRNVLYRNLVESNEQREREYDEVRMEDVEEAFRLTFGAPITASAVVGNVDKPLVE